MLLYSCIHIATVYNEPMTFKNIPLTTLSRVSQEDLKIPTGSSILVTIEVRDPKPDWESFRISKVSYEFGEGQSNQWTHSATMPLIAMNVYKWLLDNEEFDYLPKIHPALQMALDDEMKDGNLGASTDFQKGLVVAMYNWVIDKYPAGITGQVMEYYTGLAPKRASNIFSRISCTFQQLNDEGMSISKYKNKVVINKKSVYFVKHTDTKLKGGYMPKWVETIINDYINETYPTITAGRFSLDPEHRGSVG